MKKILAITFVVITALAFTIKDKPSKSAFKVFGNCPQCKERIEGALDTRGVKAAEWNVKTKMMEVVYQEDKISLAELHKRVAAVGHDTEKEKAPDEVYLQLPDCCMYRDNDNTHFD